MNIIDGHGRIGGMTTDGASAHEGPCLNYEGQNPAGYDDYDSCYLHLQASDMNHRLGEVLRGLLREGYCYLMPVLDDDGVETGRSRLIVDGTVHLTDLQLAAVRAVTVS